MSAPENQTNEPAPSYAAPQSHEAAPPEEPARLGPFSRLTGALLSPGETFTDVNRKPTWLAPMIIAIVTVIASTLFFQWRVHPDWDQTFRTQFKKQAEKRNQQITDDQMNTQVKVATTFAKFAPIVAAVVTPIFYLILAGIFALGLMMIQAKTTYKKILSVIAWSFAATSIVATLVTMASLMVRDEESLRSIDPTQAAGIVPTNLAAFLPSETSAVIKSLAASIDIFTIWLLILLTIGFAAIAGSKKITTGKAATVVFGFWAVFVLIKVGWVAAFGG